MNWHFAMKKAFKIKITTASFLIATEKERSYLILTLHYFFLCPFLSPFFFKISNPSYLIMIVNDGRKGGRRGIMNFKNILNFLGLWSYFPFGLFISSMVYYLIQEFQMKSFVWDEKSIKAILIGGLIAPFFIMLGFIDSIISLYFS